MAIGALSAQRISGQLERVLGKRPDARFVAIRSPARGAWPQHLSCGGRRFELRWCHSPLEIRDVLSEPPDDGLVILTDLRETDLGGDVLARLCLQRLFSVESWQMLGDAFQARKLDPRLRGCDWMAELLLERRPPEGYPPAPSGVLNADTAWGTLLSTVLGLPDARPDLETLLQWTAAGDGPYRFGQLPEAARSGIAIYLREVCGMAGALVIDALVAGNGADAVALGLACEVVFSDGWTGSELLSAAVRLEPLVGRTQIPAPAARLWAQTAVRVARRQTQTPRAMFQQAEDVLRTVRAFDHVALSTLLPAAFEMRFGEAAAAIDHALASASGPSRAGRPAPRTSAPAPSGATRGVLAGTDVVVGDTIDQAEQAAARVFDHHQAALQPVRSERLRMALRLLRWLAARADGAEVGFEDIALRYVADGSYVDWARTALLGGDELATVSAVYVGLAAQVRSLREQQNRAFAEALARWNQEAAPLPSLTPIEAVLDRVVAPVATTGPVLVLVLDGMSFAVFRRLSADLAEDGWNELAIDEAPAHAAVATVPTVTEAARASLLCGRVCRGGASVEKTGFAGHAGLCRVTHSGLAPVLFHKGELSSGGALADDVRLALGDMRQRVVGIVYNAVDDHLDGADQARPRWALDDMQLLRPIIHEARNAGRTIVLTADHGHVLEDGSRQATKGIGDRWRPWEGGAPGEGEMAFHGPRVLSPEGAPEVVVPWSELVRYGGKKTGYHGGVTPQEVLVPLAVFTAATDAPLWRFSPPATPDWWTALVPSPVSATPVQPAPEKRRRPKNTSSPRSQPSLFSEQGPAAPAGPTAAADWLDALLGGDIFQAQCKLAGRGAARPEDVRAVLSALAPRGRVPRAALARQLGQPLFRLNGLLSSVRRLVNIDQSPILTVDDAGDWVELDLKQLAAQFEIMV